MGLLEDRITEAMDVINRFGMIDEMHHKQWILDQVVRKIKGPEEYKKWRDEYDTHSRKHDYQQWDEGIAP